MWGTSIISKEGQTNETVQSGRMGRRRDGGGRENSKLRPLPLARSGLWGENCFGN